MITDDTVVLPVERHTDKLRHSCILALGSSMTIKIWLRALLTAPTSNPRHESQHPSRLVHTSSVRNYLVCIDDPGP